MEWLVLWQLRVFQLTRNLSQARQEGRCKQIQILGALVNKRRISLQNKHFFVNSYNHSLFLMGTNSHPSTFINKFHTSIQANTDFLH